MAAALTAIPWQRGSSVTLQHWTSRVRHFRLVHHEPSAKGTATPMSVGCCYYCVGVGEVCVMVLLLGDCLCA